MANALENKDTEELKMVFLVKRVASACCNDLLERHKTAPEANAKSERPQRKSGTGS